MASSSSSHHQNAFPGLEAPDPRREVEGASRVYDVFINHRGPDVKLTLATRLYSSLQERNIRAFLDSQEKELGIGFPCTIETAIRSASVHVAIFSRRYAESAWCLAELVLMLQSKAKIIPVFYQVEPWELRRIENGVYAEAFTKHATRYPHKLMEWKGALQQVSFTAGYEVNNSNYGDCNEILSAVEKEIQRTKLLHVARYPVGLHKLVGEFERRCLDELVEDFERRCGVKKAAKNKANIVGIFGMGGVGKTTLSLELFNKKRSNYARASFLYDVREACSSGNLPLLQSQLLKDIFSESNHRFPSSREGTSHVRNRLERSISSSFLIVLDDIDHVEQLEALLPIDILNKHCKKNHMIIITTRDVEVLETAGIDNIYNLQGLDGEDGRELFCWHAFNQPLPPCEYEDPVKEFVNLCGGLPLLLLVLGRHVSRKPLRDWEEELVKVRKALPGDVKKSLRISFDALDNKEQQIFMDIACFFVGKSVTEAMSIWRGLGWEATLGLETLKNKCLVEEVKQKLPDWLQRSTFRMHDHLRDLGREMADEQSHPPRLWRPQVLKSLASKGFQNVLEQTRGRCYHSIVDKSIGSRITYFLGGPDTSLLWLHIEYPRYQPVDLYPDKNSNILSCIPLENLQCLIINNACFQKLWQSNVQAPPNLKVIQITCCKNFKTFSATFDLCRLVEIKISECQELEELSLADMSFLEKIKVEFCDSLQIIMLPTTVIEVDIQSCRDLQMVAGADDFTDLRRLVIKECSALAGWPSFIRSSYFETIVIESCDNLHNIAGIKGPYASKYMKLCYCSKTVMRHWIRKLQSVPSCSTVLIGSAVNDQSVFSEATVGMDRMMEIGTDQSTAGITVCFLVAVDRSRTPVEEINRSLSNYGIQVREGKWIITIVAGDDEGYAYLDECESVLWGYGIVEKRFSVAMKSEQWRNMIVLDKILNVFHE